MLYQFLSDRFSEIIDKDKHSVLWSGCGEVRKMRLDGQHAVVKYSQVPKQLAHRHIEQSDFALSRKLNSYAIELKFYQDHSKCFIERCRVPKLLFATEQNKSTCLVLEDFTAYGYASPSDVSQKVHYAVLGWLARFHSFTLNNSGIGWHQGGYWHLATRPDEWQRMQHHALKTHAQDINDLIEQCPYRCVIHGDAKLANFALNSEFDVIGYDFQYVGAGVGVQDVMLYLTSVCDSSSLHESGEHLLAYYFLQLSQELRKTLSEEQTLDVVNYWQALWPVVWADFHRFLTGWKPDHFKINQYMLAQTSLTLSQVRQ
ncbi:phosphotransferase [Pseudoalteromonas sp. A25]|uniref:phosphotransferase n=1 Tax=Pseudoalteromonas sp. A25 TaxID=116092 RepID=UPI001260A42A|nr:phosphotransferase [Pseudoalteromonas sp. A25]BBN83393.1 phosphotransferase [Pseudoalteromonas sp. A25]